jgi:hypothetical protein
MQVTNLYPPSYNTLHFLKTKILKNGKKEIKKRVKYTLDPSTNNYFFIKLHKLTGVTIKAIKLPIFCN